MPEKNTPRALMISRYERKKMLITFFVVMIALITDVSISNVADIVSGQIVTFWGISLFIAISAVFAVGQYLMIGMIKTKNKETKVSSYYIRIFDMTATILQYVITAIMIFVVLQIIVIHNYYTILLSIATAISYGFAVFFMTMLAYRFLSWFRISKNLVVLIFGLAAIMICTNAVDSILFFDGVLLDKPALISPQSQVIFQTGFYPGTFMSFVSIFQAYSLNAYFILTWAGTILLLRHHIQRVGRIKFWTVVTFPIIFFMSYYISYYQTFNPSSPVTAAISSNLMIPIYLITASTTLCGILFGLGFWSLARALPADSRVKDYMIITACGFILYFNCGQASVLQAAYPPYGLANVSFVGLASFLILIGLYNSATSVAQDAKLRKSIKNSTLQQSSKLLDTIGTAQMTEEIENKVVKMTQENALTLTQQSGVEPSLTENEIKLYVDRVLEEVKTKRQST
jgi:hypothetical protein